MKRAVLLIAILSALIGGGLACSRVPAERFVALPSVVPGSGTEGLIARISDAFPRRSAQVVVTARLPFAAIQQQAEQAVPPGLHREYGVDDTNGFSNIRVNPDISRDPVSLQPEVNSTPPKMRVASKLHGTVAVKAEKRVAVDLFLARMDQRIPVSQPDIRVAANIRGWISPGIDQKWMFTHNEMIDVDVTQAEFKLFGIVPVSIKEEVQKKLNGAAPRMIKNTLDSIGDKLPIRAGLEKVWRELFKPIKVGSPDAYLVLAPQRARLVRVAFDDPNYLTVGVALDGPMQTLVQGTAPPQAPPTPIPDLAVESGNDPVFHAIVPLGLELSAINQTLKGQVGDQPIRLAKDETVVVKGCEFDSRKGALYVKLDIDAESKKLATKAKGTIFLKGDWVYDEASHALRLGRVDFSAETRNMLGNAAPWLLDDLICRRIEESVKLDIGSELKTLQADVNQRYAALNIAPEARMKSHLDTVKFAGVRLGDGTLVFGFDLGGEVACAIDIQEKN